MREGVGERQSRGTKLRHIYTVTSTLLMKKTNHPSLEEAEAEEESKDNLDTRGSRKNRGISSKKRVNQQKKEKKKKKMKCEECHMQVPL